MSRNVVVILAHPDDESFPMGGTLARYAAEGAHVTLVCATRGEAGIPNMPPDEAGRLRERELRAAAETLGVADVRFLGYRDGQLAQVDPEIVVAQLVGILYEVHPHVVITFGPDGISDHPDHLVIHRFVTAAFDRAGLPARLFYLAPSEATRQDCGVTSSQGVAGGPVAVIDVGDYRLTKVRAMQQHASQDPPYAGPPEEEAPRLTCHEYFTLARPVVASDLKLKDLLNGDLRV